MNNEFAHAESPEEVLRQTATEGDPAGDGADQAERLTMIMEAEALRNALHGDPGGEGSLDGFDYPLANTEELVADEGGEDSSDDMLHAGGLHSAPLMSPERAAMHIIDAGSEDSISSLGHRDAVHGTDADSDPFDEPATSLTPEDETLIGLDPYE
jgi:hypothetical protein